MYRRSLVSVALGALALACAVPVYNPRPAQLPVAIVPFPDGGGHSQIGGKVVDYDSGKPLKDAVIIVQCPCFTGMREQPVNADGLYSMGGLPPGKYTVEVLIGQAHETHSFELGPTTRARADFRLRPMNVLG